jgi:hypothetical protein
MAGGPKEPFYHNGNKSCMAYAKYFFVKNQKCLANLSNFFSGVFHTSIIFNAVLMTKVTRHDL